MMGLFKDSGRAGMFSRWSADQTGSLFDHDSRSDDHHHYDDHDDDDDDDVY